MELEIEKDLSKSGIHVETGIIHNVYVRFSRKEVFKILSKELKLLMKERFRDPDDIKEDHTVKALRSFYWSVGIDPTKTRPSSEALLRRLIKKELPMINNLVDAGNFASVKTIIPIGIYDLDMVSGPLFLRKAKEGEIFQGIGGKERSLQEGTPIIADDEGVVHIYPHRDCLRTRITEDTEKAFVIACGAPGIRKGHLSNAIKDVEFYWDQLRE